MYVISAMVKYHFEDEPELRFAGCDNGSYGSGYPCWHRPNDKDVKYFNTIEKAEEWFSRCEEDLGTNGSHTVKELAITEIAYNTVKQLSGGSSVAHTCVFEKPTPTNHLADKSIDDVMRCPYCNSNHCCTDINRPTDVDAYLSEDNTGEYSVRCYCNNCMNSFDLNLKFRYELASASTTKRH